MNGFSLTLTVKTADDVDRLFKALSEGGKVQQQPTETFFSKRFAMTDDRYGVNWILLVEQEMGSNSNANRKNGSLASV